MLRLDCEPPPAKAECVEPHVVIGQDARFCWLAIETHDLGGGIFKSREDALHFVDFETGHRPVPSSCLPSRCSSGAGDRRVRPRRLSAGSRGAGSVPRGDETPRLPRAFPCILEDVRRHRHRSRDGERGHG